jgi:uridine kinase
MQAQTQSSIQYSDALMHEIATRAVSHVSPHRKLPYVIAVSGGTSTGKTTMVGNRLLEYLGDKICSKISLDNFQKGRESKHLFTGKYGHDTPEYFELENCHSVLKRLKEGHAVEIPRYSYKTGKQEGYRLALPKSIIIIEGLFASYGPLQGLADFSIYVESPCYARMLRRMMRNMFERYNAHPSLTLKGFAKTLPAHNELISEQKKRADICIRTPYRFSESIQRFQLEPIAQPSLDTKAGIPVLSVEADEETEFTFYSIQEKHYFVLTHKNAVYFEFELNEAVAKTLVKIDFEPF